MEYLSTYLFGLLEDAVRAVGSLAGAQVDSRIGELEARISLLRAAQVAVIGSGWRFKTEFHVEGRKGQLPPTRLVFLVNDKEGDFVLVVFLKGGGLQLRCLPLEGKSTTASMVDKIKIFWTVEGEPHLFSV